MRNIMLKHELSPNWRTGLVAVFAAVLLSACGGGADVQSNAAPPPSGGGKTYTGPPPATPDIQAFRIELWENIRTDNRCGGCHNEGGQSPMFARSDDVNLAYQDANTVVDLTQPAQSRMVTKVGGGHNCWLTSDQACADILTTWITNWAGAAAGGGRTINLTAPPIKDPGASKHFPADPSLYQTHVYTPVTEVYCQGCHAQNAAAPQTPFFADEDIFTAYDGVKSKIDLDDPANSRLVLRLRDEFHNCWSDCAQNAQMMEDAITAMAANITPTQIDPSFITSKALTLYDGTIASGGNRYETSQIALWEFKAGQGTTAFDTSGVDPAIDLTLSGDVEWVGGWGINVKDGKAQGTTATSKKLHDLIKGTGEYSIEAWVAPGNVTQEDARIVSYTGGPMARNFSLSQTLYNYDYLNRSSATDAEGNPMFSTPDADEVLQATLQHVVVTFDPVDGRKIYVNGQLVADMDPAGGGTLADWDDTFAFVLGNEVSNDGLWMGVMRMVAIHNRVLTPAQIQQNLDVGVGEKFFLLFSVEHLINVPQSYIMLEGAQFDSYGYLFNTPTFISLDPTATPGSIPLQKMRVGINGQEAPVGQAYKPLDTVITDAAYTPTGMQQLASIGTVIPLEKGPDSDEFFLTFELLGGNSAPRVEPPPVIPPPPPDDPPVSDIGVKTFDEINASMSQATTISMMNSNVQATYQKVKQSLPAVETIEAFAAPQQMAVAQLSIEYCNALVDDTGARATYFPTFTGFNTNPNNPAAAFGVAPNAQRDAVLDPLITSVMNTNLGSQPSAANVKAELNNLIDRLVPCSGAACIGRTATIVKAVCSAAVGSGGLTVQ